MVNWNSGAVLTAEQLLVVCQGSLLGLTQIGVVELIVALVLKEPVIIQYNGKVNKTAKMAMMII